jgi:uncharacterized protein YndB with AHSA1/START domain
MTAEHGVTVVRKIAAPAEAIYAAWTVPPIVRT